MGELIVFIILIIIFLFSHVFWPHVAFMNLFTSGRPSQVRRKQSIAYAKIGYNRL